MPDKTLEQYQRQIDALRKALALPNLPDDERRIHEDTIRKIQDRIAAMEAAPAPQPPAQRHSAPTERRSYPKTAGQDSQPAQRVTFRTIVAGKPEETTVTPAQPVDSPMIYAASERATRTVTIDWGHGRADNLTEGECRGRFTTALRDLANSRLARQGRMRDIPAYLTFQRAVAYYHGLCLLWGHTPSPLELEIHPLGRKKAEIFEMIAAEVEQKNSEQ